MGRKGYKIHEIIEQELNKGPKSGRELKKYIMSELGTEVPKNFDKTFIGDLIKLLEKERIKIVGYKPDDDYRKVKQAFKADPVIFDSSKRLTRPEINELLNEMNEKDESYQRIRELFKQGLRDLDDLENYRRDYLKKWIFYATPQEIKDNIFLYYPDIEEKIQKIYENNKKELMGLFGTEEELSSFLEKEREAETDIHSDPRWGKFVRIFDGSDGYDEFVALIILNLRKRLKELSMYENKDKVRIWFYPLTPSRFRELWRPLPTLPEKLIKTYDEGYDIITDKMEELPQYIIRPPDKRVGWNVALLVFQDNHKWVDFNEENNKEIVLLNGGFFPHSKEIDDPDLSFEHTIDIISTYSKENREILLEILAKGLSNEPGSVEVFGEFYYKIEKVNYVNRIKSVFGMFDKYLTSEKFIRL